MKKQIFIIIFILMNMIVEADTIAYESLIDVRIEKVIYKPSGQLLINTIITNNENVEIMIPALAQTDDYGNAITNCRSFIEALSYNSSNQLIKTSEKFQLTVLPDSRKGSVRLKPGESYKITHLVYKEYGRGPKSFFGIDRVPNLTQLDVRLNLDYLLFPDGIGRQCVKYSNRVSIDERDFDNQQPQVTIPPPGTMLGSVYLNAGLINIDSKVVQNGTNLKSASLILNFNINASNALHVYDWSVIGTVSSDVLPDRKYEWEWNYNNKMLYSIVLQAHNGVGYISVKIKQALVSPLMADYFAKSINQAFSYQMK